MKKNNHVKNIDFSSYIGQFPFADILTRMIRYLSRPFSILSLLASSYLITPALALRRTAGPSDNYRFVRASNSCGVGDPKSFEFGACSILITCVYETLSEAYKANLSTGTNIASLLPTILVLIGELELFIES